MTPTKDELITFLTAWEHVGNLQTTQSREKFRKEARYWISRLSTGNEPLPETPVNTVSDHHVRMFMDGAFADVGKGQPLESHLVAAWALASMCKELLERRAGQPPPAALLDAIDHVLATAESHSFMASYMNVPRKALGLLRAERNAVTGPTKGVSNG